MQLIVLRLCKYLGGWVAYQKQTTYARRREEMGQDGSGQNRIETHKPTEEAAETTIIKRSDRSEGHRDPHLLALLWAHHRTTEGPQFTNQFRFFADPASPLPPPSA